MGFICIYTGLSFNEIMINCILSNIWIWDCCSWCWYSDWIFSETKYKLWYMKNVVVSETQEYYCRYCFSSCFFILFKSRSPKNCYSIKSICIYCCWRRKILGSSHQGCIIKKWFRFSNCWDCFCLFRMFRLYFLFMH